MKVCLYLEANDLLGQSGIGTAIIRQQQALEKAGVEFTTNPADKDYDLIHINTFLPKSLLYAKRMKKQGKRVILHAHTLDVDTKNSFTLSNEIMPFLKRYLRYFYSQADHIICPSEYAKNMLIQYGLRNNMSVVSNGVDLGRFSFDEKKRAAYRERYNLEGMVPFSVGHVFLRKGVRSFVGVAKSFPNTFVWFGKVYSKFLVSSREVEELIRKRPENVIFTGYVDDILAAYCAGDVFFFPSQAETQGIVILEAMACERPVLIRDLPVFDGWLKHDHDCLKAKNDEEFVLYLDKLINEGGLRKRLVSNAKETVKEHSLEKVGLELKSVYEKVLGS
ncbi:MAG: glycosyltransferase family 4 protein [Candidatus Altiarchaeota archaeon]|nr:glycosyltransferase family 4 protein [Candidatus Altiarchaeota archaeon]